jgi:hypothetical protein
MGGTPHWRRGHLAWLQATARTTAAERERHGTRKAALARLLKKAQIGLQFNEHITVPGDIVLRHACKLGLERHRLEATGVALHQRPLARLAQVQEPCGAGGEAGVRGRLGNDAAAVEPLTRP